MKKYSIVTLGCKVNQYESSVISNHLEEMGYVYVKFPAVSDIYVVNTCTVTGMSDRKSRQILSRFKKTNEKALIIATGCLAQNRPDSMLKNGANIVLGNVEKNYIKETIDRYFKENMQDNEEKLVEVGDIAQQRAYVGLGFSQKTERTRSYLKVQDGCDNYCAYCIIPYARGRSRSRDLDDVVEEAKHLASLGVKELVLTGIHLNSYGKDLEEIDLSSLVLALEDVEGIERVRLGSMEPKAVTRDFIEALAKSKKLCPHFHMSLQSGSDKVLKDMRRRYDSSEYLLAMERIKEYFPSAKFTTDIIVGYPTEEDADFKDTINLVKKAGFLKIHVFKYSKRPGTMAAKLKELDPQILAQRSEYLVRLADQLSHEILKKEIGKTITILVEEIEKDYVIGHSDSFMKVYGSLDKDMSKEEKDSLINSFLHVYIEDVKDENLYGKVIF